MRDRPHSIRHAWTPRPKSQIHHSRAKCAANKYCSAHYTSCTAWPLICISHCVEDNLDSAPVVPTKVETWRAQEERGIRSRKWMAIVQPHQRPHYAQGRNKSIAQLPWEHVQYIAQLMLQAVITGARKKAVTKRPVPWRKEERREKGAISVKKKRQKFMRLLTCLCSDWVYISGMIWHEQGGINSDATNEQLTMVPLPSDLEHERQPRRLRHSRRFVISPSS